MTYSASFKGNWRSLWKELLVVELCSVILAEGARIRSEHDRQRVILTVGEPADQFLDVTDAGSPCNGTAETGSVPPHDIESVFERLPFFDGEEIAE